MQVYVILIKYLPAVFEGHLVMLFTGGVMKNMFKCPKEFCIRDESKLCSNKFLTCHNPSQVLN